MHISLIGDAIKCVLKVMEIMFQENVLMFVHNQIKRLLTHKLNYVFRFVHLDISLITIQGDVYNPLIVQEIL